MRFSPVAGFTLGNKVTSMEGEPSACKFKCLLICDFEILLILLAQSLLKRSSLSPPWSSDCRRRASGRGPGPRRASASSPCGSCSGRPRQERTRHSVSFTSVQQYNITGIVFVTLLESRFQINIFIKSNINSDSSVRSVSNFCHSVSTSLRSSASW